MSTDRQDALPPEDETPLEPSEDEADALMQLLEELDNIDENAEDVVLNKYSISDNNGGRIELIKRSIQKLPVFLPLRRLLLVSRKTAKPE